MAAISSGSPARPRGVRDRMPFRASGLPSTALRARSVMMVPGPMPQTRMWCGAKAMAAFFVSWFRPPLDRL